MRRWALLAFALSALAAISAHGAGIGFKRDPFGDSTVPGVSGTTGNEATVSYLYGLKHFAELPPYPIVYVSADGNGRLPAGVDTNIGSMEAPLRTLEAVDDLVEVACGITFIFDTDWWDDVGDYGATWDGAIGPPLEACGNTLDQPSHVFLSISRDPAEPFHIDCRATTAAMEPGLNSGTFLTTETDGAEGPAYAIENFHSYYCPGEPDTNGTDVFHGAIVSLNTFCEKVSGQNRQCHSTHGSGSVAINARWSVRDGAEFNSNCAGAQCGVRGDPEHAEGTICTAGVAATPWECCNGATPALCTYDSQFVSNAGGSMTLISDATYTDANTQPRGTAPFLLGTATDHADYTIIGPTFEKSAANAATATSAIEVECEDAASNVKTNIAYTTILGFDNTNDNGLLLRPPAAANSCFAVTNLYHMTFDDNFNHIRQTALPTGGNGSYTWDMRCVTFENEGQFIWLIDTVTDTDEVIDLSARQCVWDDDNVANSFSIDGTTSAGRPELETDLNASPEFFCGGDATCATNLFDNADTLESGGVGVNGTILDASTSLCLQTGVCETTCTLEKTITLPMVEGGETQANDLAESYIPAFVAGAKITQFTFKGDTHIGAR